MLEQLGFLGLFIGTFLAATVLPFSSDFLLIGAMAGGSNIITTVIVASLGNWAGGMFSFWMGWVGRWQWIEKWFHVKEETLVKQKSRIDRYGSLLAFLSWLPMVGDLFALGLGFYKVNPPRVALFMLVGKSARFIMWAILFHYFGADVIAWF